MTQISSIGPTADGRGMISADDERKPWLTALEARFAQAEPNLSASRQQLLRNILDHAEETYFLSSRALAKRYDLDPTTIVRTVQALGYKRYGEFAADLRSHFVTRITPYAVMKSAVRDKRSIANHIEHTLEIDVQNLNALRSQLDVKQVVEIAKRIDRAGRIMVVGIDFAASLSNLLAYGLVSIGYDAEAPAGSAGNLRQKILLLGPRDLLIAISFGRCLQDTVDSVIRAHDNGVPTVGFTDSDKSPIARFSDASASLEALMAADQLIPAAQYLRMSTEHQQYSIDNQARSIEQYAKAHGFAITRTYSDSAKSGLWLRNRPGLC